MQDTSQNSFFPQETYACETATGTEMTIPLQREDKSELCSFKCLRVLAAKTKNNAKKKPKQQLWGKMKASTTDSVNANEERLSMQALCWPHQQDNKAQFAECSKNKTTN